MQTLYNTADKYYVALLLNAARGLVTVRLGAHENRGQSPKSKVQSPKSATDCTDFRVRIQNRETQKNEVPRMNGMERMLRQIDYQLSVSGRGDGAWLGTSEAGRSRQSPGDAGPPCIVQKAIPSNSARICGDSVNWPA